MCECGRPLPAVQISQRKAMNNLLVHLPGFRHEGEANLNGGRFSTDPWGWIFPDNEHTFVFIAHVEQETGEIVEVQQLDQR